MSKINSKNIIISILFLLISCSGSNLKKMIQKGKSDEALSFCASKQGSVRKKCFESLLNKFSEFYTIENEKVKHYSRSISEMEDDVYSVEEDEISKLQNRIYKLNTLKKVHQKQADFFLEKANLCKEAL